MKESNGGYNVDNLIVSLERKFQMIIAKLTQPDLSTRQKVKALEEAKAEYITLINEMAGYKRQIGTPDASAKINDLVKKCNDNYKNAIEFIANDIAGDDPFAEYVDEVNDKVEHSTVLPTPLLNGNAKEYIMSQKTGSTDTSPIGKLNLQGPVIGDIVDPDIEISPSRESLLDFGLTNTSIGIEIEDGEEITAPAGVDLFYLIKPITEDCKIKLIRFENSDTLSNYINEHYRASRETPVIIRGVTAKLDFQVSITI